MALKCRPHSLRIIATVILLSVCLNLEIKANVLLSVNKPVIIGKTITLSCSTQNETLYRMNGRTWSKQVANGQWDVILYYGQPAKIYEHKYREAHGERELEYILKIYDTSEEDINVKYACTYGQKQAEIELKLNSKEYLYFPKVDEMKSVSTLTTGRLMYRISILKIFPQPTCSIISDNFKDLNSSSYNVTEGKIYYQLEAYKSFLINKDVSEGVVSVFCTLAGTDYDLRKENMQVFAVSDQSDAPSSSCVSDIVIGVVVSAGFTALFVSMMCCCKGRCGKNCLCFKQCQETRRTSSQMSSL